MVGIEDRRRCDLVLGGQGVKGVTDLDRGDQPVDRRDHQRLADRQGVLGGEVVGPPQGHHREAELGRDAAERVATLDDVVLQEAGRVLDRGVDRDRLPQRAVIGVSGQPVGPDPCCRPAQEPGDLCSVIARPAVAATDGDARSRAGAGRCADRRRHAGRDAGHRRDEDEQADADGQGAL